MRLIYIFVPVLMLAATAQAEPLLVKKGMWSVSTDVYTEARDNGQRIDIPSEHTAYDQCWSTDQEVTIDDNIVSAFGDCVVEESWLKAYSYDADIICHFDGLPMSGIAQFVINRDANAFSGRFSLQGHQNAMDVTSDALLMGHWTGTCTAPN